MLYYIKIGVCYEDIPAQVVYPDPLWRSRAEGKTICPECMCINRRSYPSPVDVVLEESPNEDQTAVLVETTGITIWRSEFVDKLSRYQGGFVWGKCMTSEGETISDYVTCYLPRFITIRGNKQSRYQICPACGAILSHNEPGPKYILSSQLSEARIYQDALCRFYVTEEVVDDFEDRPEDVAFDAVSVRNTPVDGQILPGDGK
jgi:hypothetical protein